MPESGIQSFYERFFAVLEADGVPVVILGGQAMLRHRLAETTKDADLFVRAQDFGGFLATLARMRFEGAAPIYRAAVSAPLATPWAAGGWGSHFEFPVERGPRPRIDVLARPPRIDPRGLPNGGVAPIFLLAETKKTRREAKDWGQVATLGHLLLDAGDARGLLFVQDAEELVARLPQHRFDEHLAEARPALRLAWEGSESLVAAIETERRFWRYFDAERIAVFERASRDYAHAVRAEVPQLPDELLAQHGALQALANVHLPADPLREVGVLALIAAARQRALVGYPPAFQSFLPPENIVARPWT